MLFDLLMTLGTPYDGVLSDLKLDLRQGIFLVIDNLLRVEDYAMFIMENCFNKVMGLFADNLMKAKDWCSAQRQKSALKA